MLAIIPPATIDEGSLLSFTATAADQDTPANKLSYSFDAGFPPGASINATNGLFTWTSSKQQAPSTNFITVRVSDDGSPALTDTKTFTVVVNRINSAPVVSPIPDQFVAEGTALSFAINATDPDGAQQRLTFGFDGPAPTGVALDSATGAFNWTPSEEQGPSTNVFRVRVVDDGVPSLSATNSFMIVVNEVNSAPVLTVPGTQTIDELTTLVATNRATDGDIPANALTFGLVSGPPGAIINPANGVLTWTPAEAQGPNTYTVSVRVTDNGVPNLSATNSFTVIVQEVNSPPTLAAVADRTVDEGAPLTFTVAATDGDLPAQQLTFSLEPGAPTRTRIDPASGVFSWMPNEEQGPSTNRITVRVTDSGVPGLSDTKAFTVVVNEVNSPSTIVSITDKFVEEKTKLEFKIEATDPDIPKNGLSFSLAAEAPSGASIDSKTGIFTWTVGEVSAAQTNIITVRVVDDGLPPMAATNSFRVVITPSKLRLAPIPSVALDEGGLVTFTATSTNSPLAKPPLLFSLEPGAPTGAIMSTAGAFFWRTTELDGPSTNLITVRVTDSSLPPLIAGQSFTVVVKEVNRAPVLAAVARQTNVVGRTLTIQLLARDEDLPTNNLTFSLEPGAPAGASIDPTSGVFTWTPGPTSASSTNTIAVRVTDGGLSPLSDVKTFVVVVMPPCELKLSALILASGQLQLTLCTEPGRTYFIESSASLKAGDWQLMTNIVSTSTSAQIIDPRSTGLQQRFYRAISP